MAAVLVSSRTADARMAKKPAVDLRQVWHGARPERWESVIGNSILEQISKGLAELSCLLPYCSDVGPKRAWQNREWRPTLARRLSGEPVKILPVCVSDGTPPAIRRDLRYAALARDWDEGARDLLAAIQ